MANRIQLLLDQGLPRSAVDRLADFGIGSTHFGSLGMSTAADVEILEYASASSQIVVTLDSDFHALLARQQRKLPSVKRIGIEGLNGDEIAKYLDHALSDANAEICTGAAVTITRANIRIRKLPLGGSST